MQRVQWWAEVMYSAVALFRECSQRQRVPAGVPQPVSQVNVDGGDQTARYPVWAVTVDDVSSGSLPQNETEAYYPR